LAISPSDEITSGCKRFLPRRRKVRQRQPFRVLQDATAIRLGLEAIGRDDVTPDDLAETDHFDIGRHEATADLGDAGAVERLSYKPKERGGLRDMEGHLLSAFDDPCRTLYAGPLR